MPSWRRNINTSSSINLGSYWNDAIAAGDSYLRVHIRWGFYADVPSNTDLNSVAGNLVTFGLVTTIGNGSETPPNARSGSGDASPPTQRWIYWETRQPTITAVDAAAGIVTWHDSAPTEPTQTKGQVLATGIPAGDSLNLWASWASAGDWGSYGGNAFIWHSVSILRKI